MNFQRRFLRTVLNLLLLTTAVYAIFRGCLEISLRNGILKGSGVPWSFEHLRDARILMRESRTDDIPDGLPRKEYAEGIRYKDLLADGDISISIYREKIHPRINWEPEFTRIRERAAQHQVRLRLLTDSRDLQQAMRSHDLVMFSGHSNLGQGLNVHSVQLQTHILWRVSGAVIQTPLPKKYLFTDTDIRMGEFPEIRTPLFFHLGCRSEIYYREALTRASQDTFFIFTQYEWSPGTEILRAIDLMSQTFEKRQHIDVMLDHWEKLYAPERMMGRARQARKYPQETRYPKRLFIPVVDCGQPATD